MRQRAAAMLKVAPLLAVATVAFGAFAFGTSERAAACSCASFTDDEALENADAAFTGTLVEVITPAGDTYSSTDPERFVFEADEVFKGDVFARQSVVTAREGASCGLEISGRGPFVVFARTESDSVTNGGVNGELYSNLCSGTRPLASGSLPASFGDASLPIPGGSPVGGNGSQRPIVWIAGVGGALALIAAGWAFTRQRRTRTAT